ncbi:UNVERIFIED_CONTAM: DNA-directed RNA polymerase subunit beta [Sesamum radiatum]|uniref:DNA-directed RNA polymerase subunit beta n=1 Tax=Sesamum radiatum TaxID=300843 RepID=A0AAW2VKD6_SESRA
MIPSQLPSQVKCYWKCPSTSVFGESSLIDENIPIMSMPIESMLLAVNSNFLVFSVSSDDMMGQSFASLVSTVAAAESAIGIILHQQVKERISTSFRYWTFTTMMLSIDQIISSSIPSRIPDYCMGTGSSSKALMSSNMQRQAVPLSRSEKCIVGTGLERQAALDSGALALAERGGKIVYLLFHWSSPSLSNSSFILALEQEPEWNRKVFEPFK